MWERIKSYVSYGLLVIGFVAIYSIWGRSCRNNGQDSGGNKPNNGGIRSAVPSGWNREIKLDPKTSFSVGFSTISLASRNDKVFRSKSDVLRVDGETRSPIFWNTRSGQLAWNRYGTSFAPGISLIRSKDDYGLGVDLRGLYIGDFGLQLGADFFKHTRSSLFASVGYNLRRYPVLQNTDLVIGIDLNKTVFGGVRVELGRK